LQSNEVRKLLARLCSPLIALCIDILATANRHFDAFIKGSHPSRPAKENITTTASPSSLPNPPSSSPTYVQAATTATHKPTVHQPVKLRLARSKRPDTCLFVCLRSFHKARQVGAFALFVALQDRLGEQATLLKEVQAVKTGFALCTNSLEDLTALEKSANIITQLIGECTIER
jgi:hypothetical protein